MEFNKSMSALRVSVEWNFGKVTNLFAFLDFKKNLHLYLNIIFMQVPLVILGDSAYPSLPWLVKPYPETTTMTDMEKLYNYRQSRARMIVENSFGKLKGRWRCLLKRMDFKLENVPHVVAACVVLHNICELYGDSCPEEWASTRVPPRIPSTGLTTAQTVASTIRDAIARHLSGI